MTNALQLFNFNKQEVRAFVLNGEVWAVGKDVAGLLGYTNSRKAVIDHCKKARSASELLGSNETLLPYLDPQTKLINEADINRLILGSKLPIAEAIRDWWFEEVLPSIRKTGSYSLNKKEFDIPQTYADALMLAAKQAKVLEEQAPKVQSYDNFMASNSLLTLQEALDSIGIGRTNGMARLRELNILQQHHQSRRLPYRRYINSGHFTVKMLETGFAQAFVTTKGMLLIESIFADKPAVMLQEGLFS